mgnify:CR=1 FL=1
MRWMLSKLDKGDSTIFGNPAGPFWVQVFDDEGKEKSGAFFKTIDEAVNECKTINSDMERKDEYDNV